jgi:hypothetical protein
VHYFSHERTHELNLKKIKGISVNIQNEIAKLIGHMIVHLSDYMEKRDDVGSLVNPGSPFTTGGDTYRFGRESTSISSVAARDMDHGITIQYTDDETDSPEPSSSKGGLVFTCMLILKIQIAKVHTYLKLYFAGKKILKTIQRKC